MSAEPCGEMVAEADVYWRNYFWYDRALPPHVQLRDCSTATKAAAEMISDIAGWHPYSSYMQPWARFDTSDLLAPERAQYYRQILKPSCRLDDDAAKALDILEEFAKTPMGEPSMHCRGGYVKCGIDKMFVSTQYRLQGLLTKFLLPTQVISSECKYHCANAYHTALLNDRYYLNGLCPCPKITVHEKATGKKYEFIFNAPEEFGNRLLPLLDLVQDPLVEGLDSDEQFAGIVFTAGHALVPLLQWSCDAESEAFLARYTLSARPKTLQDLQSLIKAGTKYFNR